MSDRPDPDPRLSPFYPILPDADWMARLVPLGIRTVQLRFKSDDAADIRLQVQRAASICAAQGCRLIVNDHWRTALEAGVTDVHLGQDDLKTADMGHLAKRGVRVGLSTHDEAELDIALAYDPASIALGPIYATSTKATGRAPQGLARLTEWRRRLGTRPLTAIGGITLETAPVVRAAGADSIAVVSDVTGHRDPERRVAEWLAWERSLA
jgi:thiamine-phosphate pyrophosphorylase